MSRWHNYYMDGMVHFCTPTVNEWQPVLDDTAASGVKAFQLQAVGNGTL